MSTPRSLLLACHALNNSIANTIGRPQPLADDAGIRRVIATSDALAAYRAEMREFGLTVARMAGWDKAVDIERIVERAMEGP